jgi:hypothetical protein
MKITESKKVWVAWTNTDCTEGRGSVVPKYVCMTKATAIRLGRRGSVQGCDCEVTEEIAVKINGGCWLVPGRIEYPTVDDDKVQKRLEERELLIQKMRKLGVTGEDIERLKLLS